MIHPQQTFEYGSREDFLLDCGLLASTDFFDAEAYSIRAGLQTSADAAEHYLVTGWRNGIEPGPNFEGSFLLPYFHFAGFPGPPAITYLILRSAGWPVYRTRAQAEAVASIIRSSDLFDADAYAARLGDASLDPALHYVLVGERMYFAPSSSFDPEYYGERHSDITQAGISYLLHYIRHGKFEGRRPVSVASQLTFDRSRLDPKRETVLIVSHQASRTGAPILAYNIAVQLRRRYNVVALLLAGGELVPAFEACCSAIIGPLEYADWHPAEVTFLTRRLADVFSISYAIANSIETRTFIPALATAMIPVVTLVHEFASYTKPKGVMGEALDWSTQVVFSADITEESAMKEHPTLSSRKINVLAQGRCIVPQSHIQKLPAGYAQNIREMIRPKGADDALIVLGCGTVSIRKGVDIFLSCAAATLALNPKRPVRFVWIGQGYDPIRDSTYSTYLAEQIERSGLEDKIAIIDEIPDLETAYSSCDVFLLSSRLDPMPNVAIDAAFHGRPIICFEKASGIAQLLKKDPILKDCVVPYLDTHSAACAIANLANDKTTYASMSDTTRRFAQSLFNMQDYVNKLDQLGRKAMDVIRQRTCDLATLLSDPLFDEHTYLPPGSTVVTREDAIKTFLIRWAALNVSRQPAKNFYFRRPYAGFHPQIYAYENSDKFDCAVVNPLAHFIRSGKPDGPWIQNVIKPSYGTAQPERAENIRVGLHAHFYYPELIYAFLKKLEVNRSRCDLLLSTTDEAKAETLRDALTRYDRGQVIIRKVPNRGRDIGPLFTAFADEIADGYDIVGHFHSKRSLFADATLGETWREFLWQNLLGDFAPMMDIILGHFATDERLGMIFPDDPHLPDWDHNLALAEKLAARMGFSDSLPPFFNFPVGTMFWARPKALKPMFDLKLDWHDYPEEPAPIDGTILHALERLLPFAVRHSGYHVASTNVPGVTW
jgi:glycosyltransferase involved in cell wall biosynthesis